MRLILIRGIKLVSILRSSSITVSNNLSISTCCTGYYNTRRWKERSLLIHLQHPSSYSIPKHDVALAHFSDSAQPVEDPKKPSKGKKISIFQKMKQLAKDYWHILLPVHIATSTVWVAIFYTAVKNGVDIGNLLEQINLNGKYVEILKSSGAGNWAIIYALYKVFTPIRYTVTVGGTTMAIRQLSKLGYVKPPSFKRETIEEVHSKKSALECKASHGKAESKSSQHTDSPKT